jgi:hypothetical protein
MSKISKRLCGIALLISSAFSILFCFYFNGVEIHDFVRFYKIEQSVVFELASKLIFNYSLLLFFLLLYTMGGYLIIDSFKKEKS